MAHARIRARRQLVLIFGHGGEEPDDLINSRASFESVVESGADGVELDVRLTTDGALVLIHDPNFPDGRPVRDVPWARCPPEVIDLATALDICAGLIVNIELKNYEGDPAFDPSQVIVERILSLLGARSDKDRVLLSCFGVDAIDHVRRRRPGVATAHLVLSRRSPAEVVATCVDHGHSIIHPYLRMVDSEFMSVARAHHLTVNVWSGPDETEADVEEAVRLGVDGIITSAPRRAMEVRARHRAAETG